MRPAKTNHTITEILLRLGGILFIVGIVSFGFIYYFMAAQIKEKQKQDIQGITEMINKTIQLTSISTETLERLVDLRLYTISEFIANELKGQPIHTISMTKLNDLKQKLHVSDISLFERHGDDFVVALSTDPKEIGLGSKEWGFWFEAIKQLYERKQVTVSEGFAANNYWSGPLSLSEVVDKHYKYAYYYDGSTDFIINPYIAADGFYEFINPANLTEFINEIIRTTNHINSIAVINIRPYMLGDTNKVIQPHKDLPVLYGEHFFLLQEDLLYFKKALSEPVHQSVSFKQNGIRYQKIYLSLPEDRILTVVMNNKAETRLLIQLGVLLIITFLISVGSVYFFFKHADRRSRLLLHADKERLRIAEDFKHTISILPNAIYKCELNQAGIPVVTYLEGVTMEQYGLTTATTQGMSMIEAFESWFEPSELDKLKQAFQGTATEFINEVNGQIFHNVVKPVLRFDQKKMDIVEIAGYALDITERKLAEEEIMQLAYYDTLTGLPNRTYFIEHLRACMEQDDSSMLAVLFIDLDNFKMINDTLGHGVADKVLIQAAERLEVFMNANAFIARMGGDEFTVILQRMEGKGHVALAAQSILDQFSEPVNVQENKFQLHMSIGISLFPQDSRDIDTLLKYADMAMYKVKNHFKNDYAFFTPELQASAMRKIELRKKIKQAMQQHLFHLYYQPQMDLVTGDLIGIEALIRWFDPKEGSIAPGEFIPIAEECGFIEQLGNWVLKTACLQHQIWRERGLPAIPISINLSARQFQQRELISDIRQILSETGIDSQNLIFEITESTSMKDYSYTIQLLNELKEMGIRISIDDFGTGYSSLSYLNQFPISQLKIDRSFIRRITTDQGSELVVKSIIDLANNLNLKVIAEGVETNEQLLVLKRLGCQEIQGYFYSKPLHPEHFEEFVKMHKKA